VLLAYYPEVKPQLLELEVLETSAFDDMHHIGAMMRECAQLGVYFSLDDFGTGYSSLSYLKQLPAKILKIDQTFIRDILHDPDDVAIVKGIMGLAKAFGRDVIAEGVETQEHIDRLIELECYHAQGYAIARPMPPHALLPWLESWNVKMSMS
jgi:EAL domain-containing protein (putative c-di-GMP-specific phosphodiesterase class I)